jgi:hypothetical protein
MNGEQRVQLPEFLRLGAEAFGYRGNVWTGQQVWVRLDEYAGL